MGNTFTLLSNKVQYEISKVLSDPKAAEYAKKEAEKAAQEKADKEKADKEKADADLKSEKSSEAFKDDPKAKAAAELSTRSKTNSKKLVSDTAYWVVIIILVLILILIGIVASNNAIGYNTGFRMFWFIYGIPGVIYTKIRNIFVKDKKIDIFTSNLPFNLPYNENDHTKNERGKVIQLYEQGAPDYTPSQPDYTVGAVKPKPIPQTKTPPGSKVIDPGKVLSPPPVSARPAAPQMSYPPSPQMSYPPSPPMSYPPSPPMSYPPSPQMSSPPSPPASAPPASAPPASALPASALPVSRSQV